MTPEELFNTNRSLVGWCYKKYIKDFSNPHHEDIMSEGDLALWQACINFDPSKGCQFTTYAVPVIAGAMMKYYRDKCNVIRIPRRIFDDRDLTTLNLLLNTKSLEAEIEQGDGSSITLGDMIAGKPDVHEYITEDIVESFISTINNPVHKNLMEEYYYDAIWGSGETTQTELGKKYGNISQAQCCRLIKKYNQLFAEFLKQ